MRRSILAPMMVLLGCGNAAADPAPVAPPAPERVEARGEPAPVAAPTEPVTGVVLATAQASPIGRPDATVDLATDEGAALVSASWRYVDGVIESIEAHAAGPDLRASGPVIASHDLGPRPQRAGWDEAAWTPIAPTDLIARRGTSHLSFGWYRVAITLPERLGETDVGGSTVVLEVQVDDYAEVWVDGVLSSALGDRGGHVVAGWNAPNRVILSRDARPGQRFDVAILAINGPISVSPENFVWVRSATLDVYRTVRPYDARDALGSIERVDPRLDAIVSSEASIERVATGFDFIEGPVWTEGSLLFSDPNVNVIHRFSPDRGLSIFRTHAGYSGVDVGRYHQPGSNGLAVDAEGRLVVCEHGRRRVVRIERNGSITVIADRFEGRRLNSPNDVIVAPDGSIWFTDPPFGLPAAFDDPAKELPYSGVFRVAPDGAIAQVSRELTGPNGIALSPDARTLYVSNWDVTRRVVLRWRVADDGTVGDPETFVDLTSMTSDEALDGLEVDAQGNVYLSAPDGVRIHDPSGAHLGTIHVAERPANMAWGEDGQTLYLAAHTSLYRVRTRARGAHGAR